MVGPILEEISDEMSDQVIIAKLDIDKEVKDLENELAGLKQEEKDMRREAAGMMMDKKVHLEILKMIKEVGVPMTETAGVKMYYEVAKMAYMEGLTTGMSKE